MNKLNQILVIVAAVTIVSMVGFIASGNPFWMGMTVAVWVSYFVYMERRFRLRDARAPKFAEDTDMAFRVRVQIPSGTPVVERDQVRKNLERLLNRDGRYNENWNVD